MSAFRALTADVDLVRAAGAEAGRRGVLHHRGAHLVRAQGAARHLRAEAP